MILGNKCKSAALIGVVIPALLLQCACGPITESTAYGLVAAAVDALVAGLETSGTIPVAYAGMVQDIVNASITAEQQTVDEEAGSDTAAVKSSKILGYWEPVIASVQGLPADAELIVNALVVAIETYLAIVSPPTATTALDGSLLLHTDVGTVIVPANAKLDAYSKARRLLHIHSQRTKFKKVEAKFLSGKN